jgi:hypothetical protein
MHTTEIPSQPILKWKYHMKASTPTCLAFSHTTSSHILGLVLLAAQTMMLLHPHVV